MGIRLSLKGKLSAADLAVLTGDNPERIERSLALYEQYRRPAPGVDDFALYLEWQESGGYEPKPDFGKLASTAQLFARPHSSPEGFGEAVGEDAAVILGTQYALKPSAFWPTVDSVVLLGMAAERGVWWG